MSRPVDIFEKIVMSGANATREAILRTPAAVDTDTRTFWGSDADVTGSDPLRFDNSVTKGNYIFLCCVLFCRCRSEDLKRKLLCLFCCE